VDFHQKRLHQGNRQISGTCSKRPPSVSAHQLLWYLLTHFSYSINFFDSEDSRNMEEDPDEGDIQVEYFCD
jgi:hypothetical protein